MLCALIFVTLASLTHGFPKPYQTDLIAYETFTFRTRSDWGALPPSSVKSLKLPVPYVIIHHSYDPSACHTAEDCTQAMRSMQDFHQNNKKWVDIGYNFAVGGDGAVYEGRGWTNVGAHAPDFNTISIGIVLIGNWVSAIPPEKQLRTTEKLIAKGVELGYISEDYKLIGHRQVRDTECPGEALFKEISTWHRFDPSIKTQS